MNSQIIQLENAYQTVFTVALIVLAVMIILCLVRAIMGPSVADRIVAVNMMGTMVMVVIAILALKQNNLYRKNALCKFLLTAIENQGKEQLITDNLTIEHIMPQNKNLSTAWQKMLGENVWQSVQEKYLHTLGNLTLTAYNSELGDKPFDVKQKELDDVKTKVVVLYSDVKGRTVWNAEAIELRADRLADIIVKLYPIEQPAQTISFADPRYKEYTCDIFIS